MSFFTREITSDRETITPLSTPRIPSTHNRPDFCHTRKRSDNHLVEIGGFSRLLLRLTHSPSNYSPTQLRTHHAPVQALPVQLFARPLG